MVFSHQLAALVLSTGALVANAASFARYATYRYAGAQVKNVTTTPTLNYFPREIPYETSSMYTGAVLDDFYADVNFQFYCPHYTLVSGINAAYDATSNSYVFKVNCALLETPQGGLIKKASCRQEFMPVDNIASTVAKNPEKPPANPPAWFELPKGSNQIIGGKSTCDLPEEVIHGFTYVKYLGGKLYTDAFYKSHCCSLSDESGQKVVTQNCNRSAAFPSATGFVMQCGEGMVLKEMSSTYDPSRLNRSFSFLCCQLQTP